MQFMFNRIKCKTTFGKEKILELKGRTASGVGRPELTLLP
jgi:hypothetical protein